MERGGPPQSSPHVRTDGAPAGPGCPPTGPRTLGESARFVRCLAPARSRPAPRPAEQARNVDLLERARREVARLDRPRGRLGFRTLPGERRPPEARIPPAQVRDLLQRSTARPPAVTSPRVASGAQ